MEECRTATTSCSFGPTGIARVASVLFLATMVLGGLGEMTLNRLLVPSDAAATAQQLAGNAGVVWRGFAFYMVELGCQLAFTTLFYELLRPVNPVISLLALLFGVVGIIIKVFSRFMIIVPLLILGSAGSWGAFELEQRQALMVFALTVNAQGAGVAMIFLGVGALLTSLLMLRATFLPRFLGAIGLLGAAGWLAFFYPPVGQAYAGIITLAAVAAALVKCGWLLVFGVNERRWSEQARRTSAASRLLNHPLTVSPAAP